MVDSRTACIVLGVVFVLVGLLGFIPNPLVSEDGLFAVNPAHNIVHLASGLALLLGAFALDQSQMALKVVGIVYGLIAILGLFSGDMLLGIIHINGADRGLHILLAIVLISAGWMLPEGKSRTA